MTRVVSIKKIRAGGIRTRGLLVPNEALYQAEPRPDVLTSNGLCISLDFQNEDLHTTHSEHVGKRGNK